MPLSTIPENGSQPAEATEPETLQVPDELQTIFNRDGGKETDCTPSVKDVKLIAQPSSESLDVGVTIYGSSLDFAAVHFKLYARGLNLEDEPVPNPTESTAHCQYTLSTPKMFKQLTVGPLSAPGTKGFPTNACGVRILHFAARHQHLLHTVAGTYYYGHLVMVAITKLTAEMFQGAVIPMGQGQGSCRFMVILDPRGKETLLPQNGESCKMLFPAAKFFLSDSQVNSTSFKFFQILVEADTSATPTQLVNTKAKDYLARELTEAEVDQLSRNNKERDDANDDLWKDRVQEWAREHRDAFRPLPKDATDGQSQKPTKP
ncbi:hypothetical protein FDECE_2042 [Fusarium decemcellulare]|nr:hypothetical protein FDECE_2042 [Fusarium decemcellulare]